MTREQPYPFSPFGFNGSFSLVRSASHPCQVSFFQLPASECVAMAGRLAIIVPPQPGLGLIALTVTLELVL